MKILPGSKPGSPLGFPPVLRYAYQKGQETQAEEQRAKTQDESLAAVDATLIAVVCAACCRIAIVAMDGSVRLNANTGY